MKRALPYVLHPFKLDQEINLKGCIFHVEIGCGIQNARIKEYVEGMEGI
jgi:hypothetical protein